MVVAAPSDAVMAPAGGETVVPADEIRPLPKGASSVGVEGVDRHRK